jgi:hypothetical protein
MGFVSVVPRGDEIEGGERTTMCDRSDGVQPRRMWWVRGWRRLAVVVGTSMASTCMRMALFEKKIKKKKKEKRKKKKETSYLVGSGVQASSTGAAGIVPIVVASCPWHAGGEGEGRGENVEVEERT